MATVCGCIAALVSSWVGCSPTNAAPELLSLQPSEISNQSATEVVATGANLYDATQVNLGPGGRPKVLRTWRVRLGESGADLVQVEHDDTQTLRFTVPAGAPAGVYDVIAISPLGAAARLNAGLTVQSGSGDAGALAADGGTQVVDGGTPAADGGRLVADAGTPAADGGTATTQTLSIEDAPSGQGKPLGEITRTTDQTLTAYAVLRDGQGHFVADVAVSWSVSNDLADAPEQAVTQLTLSLNKTGEGLISAHDAAGHEATSNDLRVSAGHAVALEVQPSQADLAAGDAALQFSVHATDADGNETSDTGSLSWSIVGGSIASLDAVTGLLSPQLAGQGHVHVQSTYGASAQSDVVIVHPGALVSLVALPKTATLSADDAPLTFSASGVDAHGNAVTNLGQLTWSLATGSLGTLSSAGVLTPTLIGAATLRVVSSLGPTALTGSIQITPGRAASLKLSPASLTASVGDPATSFVATGRDADGNVTLDLGTLSYAIASGPITAVAANSGSFAPLTAGDGTINVTSSYGVSAVSGPIHVDPFTSHVRVSDVRVPDGMWPTEVNVRIEVDVANDNTRDVVLTGLSFGLTVGGNDVSSQYSIRPDDNNLDRVPAGTTVTLVSYVDVTYPVTGGVLRVTASVDAFDVTGVRVSPSKTASIPVYSSIFGPSVSLTAPVIPNNRLCVGGSVTFSSTVFSQTTPTFAWLFPFGTSSSSTFAMPSVQYTQRGAFPYVVVATDAWGVHNTAVSTKPIFVGDIPQLLAARYPTGSVVFSAPSGGLVVDMTSLPRHDLISLDPSQPLTQCDGTKLDPTADHYVTLLADRGQIDPAEDDHPELPGIQIDLAAGTGLFSNVNLLNSEPQLEGTATLYAEYYNRALQRVTAAGFTSFQTTKDTEAPRVVESLPRADCGAGCFGRGTALLFRFSEPINPNSVANVKIERMTSATSCNGSVASDLSPFTTKTYDAPSRTLYVYPYLVPFSGMVRVTLGSQITDTAANPNSLVPLVRCVGIAALSVPTTPQAPQVTTSASVFTPNGDGVTDTLSWNVSVDAASSYIELTVSRGDTVVWGQTEIVSGAATYPIVWDGRDATGRTVYAGFYRYDVSSSNSFGVSSALTTGVIQVDTGVQQLGVRRRY